LGEERRESERRGEIGPRDSDSKLQGRRSLRKVGPISGRAHRIPQEMESRQRIRIRNGGAAIEDADAG
jgi:hypothetical protein